MDVPRTEFFIATEGFNASVKNAVRVSESRIGTTHTGRQNRVLMVFTKLITHAMSTQLIYTNAINMRPDVGLLDHFTVGTLTRTIIDTTIMTLYLSEPSLSLAEWDLRRHVLYLHDLANRKRFMTAMRKYANKKTPRQEKEEYAEAKANILKVIHKRGEETGLSADQTQDLSKGQIVFMNGVRGAVREAGLDVARYDFIHTYLSNHVHAHPVSYMRANEQKISFETPSDFQFSFCVLCLEVAAEYLAAATSRIEEFTGHFDRDPNGHLD